MKKLTTIISVFSLILLLIQNPGGEAQIKTPLSYETVTGRISFQDLSVWNYGFDAAFQDGKIFIKVAIGLIPAAGVSKVEIDKIKPVWEKEIEKTWSHEVALVGPSGELYPIVVNLDFKGPRFHHEVIVHRSGHRSDELNWNLLDNPKIVSHEFGHMIGAIDEYIRGSFRQGDDNAAKKISIMKDALRGEVLPRHFEKIQEWFIKKTGQAQVVLKPYGMNWR